MLVATESIDILAGWSTSNLNYRSRTLYLRHTRTHSLKSLAKRERIVTRVRIPGNVELGDESMHCEPLGRRGASLRTQEKPLKAERSVYTHPSRGFCLFR